MKITLLKILILATLSFSVAHAQDSGPSTELVLPAIVVDAPQVEAERPRAVQVTSGLGAKPIDTPVNQLGIELTNMEHLEELSLERRGDPWWLSTKLPKNEWQNQIHADLSSDWKAKGRAQGLVNGRQTTIEAGMFQDHRDLILRENKINPYDSSLGQKQHYKNRNDRSYGQIESAKGPLRVLGDADVKLADVYAGSLLTGTQRANQGSLNARWSVAQFDILPFVQARESKFSSNINSLFSNSTSGIRGGSQFSFESADSDFTVESSLSVENMKSFPAQWDPKLGIHVT